VPWRAIDETLDRLGDLAGTVVVDVSYPVNNGEREALRGRSTAEVLQARRPAAKVCKGWNHVHAVHLTNPTVDGIAASVLITGNDAEAKALVLALARDMGFHPVDAGRLRASRDVENLVGLFARLGPFRVLLQP
jgi:predicted dinucleotide-binding enzyme